MKEDIATNVRDTQRIPLKELVRQRRAHAESTPVKPEFNSSI